MRYCIYMTCMNNDVFAKCFLLPSNFVISLYLPLLVPPNLHLLLPGNLYLL